MDTHGNAPVNDLSALQDGQASAQNQLDRLENRRSTRIRNRNGGDPYGGGSVGSGNPINLDPTCRRGGIKYAKRKMRKRTVQSKDNCDGGDGQERWEVAASPARAVSARASEVILNLSQGPVSNVADPQTRSWIDSMKMLVAARPWLDDNGVFTTNSLQSLVVRCRRSLELVAGLEFVTMINLLQLAVKTDRYCFSVLLYRFCTLIVINLCSIMRINKITAAKVYDQYLVGMAGALRPPTSCMWVSSGTEFAAIAGAGESSHN